MRFVIWFVVILLGALLALVMTARWRSPDEPTQDALYRLIAGNPDLGGITFEGYVKKNPSNEALACPAAACGGLTADVDMPTPKMQLIDVLSRIEASLRAGGEEVQLVDESILPDGMMRRYVVRTPRLRFPDTVTVKLRQSGDFAIPFLHSASQIGRYDWGANAARLKRIAAALLTPKDPGGQP
jgi:Protein of unknown function (DUF1499)